MWSPKWWSAEVPYRTSVQWRLALKTCSMDFRFYRVSAFSDAFLNWFTLATHLTSCTYTDVTIVDTNDFRIFKFPVSFHSFISVHKVTDCAEFFRLRYLTWQVLQSVSFLDHNQINVLCYWKPLQRWCKIIKFYQYTVHKVHGQFINVQHLTPYLKPFKPGSAIDFWYIVNCMYFIDENKILIS
jgi:hypothetical protein